MLGELDDPVDKNGSHFGSKFWLVVQELYTLVRLRNVQAGSVDVHIVPSVVRSRMGEIRGMRYRALGRCEEW